jgi:uncharacterized protein (TIGR03790 family)
MEGRNALQRVKLLQVVWVIVSCIAFSGQSCLAGGGPRNVLVVVNSRSSISKQIADYYRQARKIPPKNVLYINCPEAEYVTKDVCENMIRKPIYDYLSQPSMNDIDYIVLTKGVPLAADYGDSTGRYSVTSILTCVGDPSIMKPTPNPYGPYSLPGGVWLPGPEIAWSSKLPLANHRIYCVTRLDGYSFDTIKAMIDGGLSAVPGGTYLLDKRVNVTGWYYVVNERLGAGDGSAYAKLIANGADVFLDQTSEFKTGFSNLMGYFGWGSNDPNYSYSKFVGNTFRPGAIVDTFYSFSARTLNKPSSTNYDSLIAELFEKGACGGNGFVSEPYVSTATFPNILFDRYTKGFNMAESFFGAMNELFWKSCIIGDPLMAPYATPPQVTLLSLDTPLTGTNAKLKAYACDESGVSKVDFYIDDELIGSSSVGPVFEVTIDSTQMSIGEHKVEAIAYENTPVATQGFAYGIVNVYNEVSKVKKISQTFAYPDGQKVAVSDKVVTLARGIAGPGFYIQEPDRTAGIYVKSAVTPIEGSMVDVVGAMSSSGGERVIVADSVITKATTAALPRPIGINNSSLGGASVGPYTQGVAGGKGPRNIGLLVKTWGRVVGIGDGWFAISDGSLRKSINVRDFIRVYSSAVPPVGAFVSVVGICGSEQDSCRNVAIIRTRNSDDVAIIRK